MTTEDLTRRWAAAWAVARGVAVEELHGWPLVHVRSASRAAEVVCCEPSAEVWTQLLAWVAGDPSRMLTVAAADPGAYAEVLPPGVRVDRDDETLMTRDLAAAGRSPVPSGLELDVDRREGRVTVRLVDGDRVAAEGTLGVRGTDAAYDAVETSPTHRRRGLGTWVVRRLDDHALEAGATTGLLAATPDGAALYAALGWRRVAPLRSLTGS